VPGPLADTRALEIGALHLAMSLGDLGVVRSGREFLLFGRALREIDAVLVRHDAPPSL